MTQAQIDVIIRALRQVATLVVKKITLDIVANLVAAPSSGGTPVDTGWARANWIPVIGESVSGRKAPPPGDEAQTRAAAAQLRGQQEAAVAAVALGYSLSRGKVTIANNVPYIVRLDQGHSKQAPAGFVNRAIVKAVTQDIRGLST